MSGVRLKFSMDFPCKVEDLPIGLFIHTDRQRSFTVLGFKGKDNDLLPVNTETGEKMYLEDDKDMILMPAKIVAAKPRKQNNGKKR